MKKKLFAIAGAVALLVSMPQVAHAGTTSIAFSVSENAYGAFGSTDPQTKTTSNANARVYLGTGGSNAKICSDAGKCGTLRTGLASGTTYSLNAPFPAGTRVRLYVQNANTSSTFSKSESGSWASN